MRYSAVAEKLGGDQVFKPPIKTEMEFVRAVEAGLPMSAFDALLSHIDSAAALQREIYSIVGSERTLQRKRAGHRAAGGKTGVRPATHGKATPTLRLSRAESDRLARLARILVRAEEAFGDSEKAQHWLIEPNRALGGERPLALLGSDAGSGAVERVLGRIEHGVFS
jgi:uncharacterized protein (DUF2384 family)